MLRLGGKGSFCPSCVNLLPPGRKEISQDGTRLNGMESYGHLGRLRRAKRSLSTAAFTTEPNEFFSFVGTARRAHRPPPSPGNSRFAGPTEHLCRSTNPCTTRQGQGELAGRSARGVDVHFNDCSPASRRRSSSSALAVGLECNFSHLSHFSHFSPPIQTHDHRNTTAF